MTTPEHPWSGAEDHLTRLGDPVLNADLPRHSPFWVNDRTERIGRHRAPEAPEAPEAYGDDPMKPFPFGLFIAACLTTAALIIGAVVAHLVPW